MSCHHKSSLFQALKTAKRPDKNKLAQFTPHACTFNILPVESQTAYKCKSCNAGPKLSKFKLWGFLFFFRCLPY